MFDKRREHRRQAKDHYIQFRKSLIWDRRLSLRGHAAVAENAKIVRKVKENVVAGGSSLLRCPP